MMEVEGDDPELHEAFYEEWEEADWRSESDDSSLEPSHENSRMYDKEDAAWTTAAPKAAGTWNENSKDFSKRDPKPYAARKDYKCTLRRSLNHTPSESEIPESEKAEIAAIMICKENEIRVDEALFKHNEAQEGERKSDIT